MNPILRAHLVAFAVVLTACGTGRGERQAPDVASLSTADQTSHIEHGMIQHLRIQ